MQNSIVLVPAYGRTYPNGMKAQYGFMQGEDWKDARTYQYCSRRDFTEGTWFVELRFGKNFENFRLVTLDNGVVVG